VLLRICKAGAYATTLAMQQGYQKQVSRPLKPQVSQRRPTALQAATVAACT